MKNTILFSLLFLSIFCFGQKKKTINTASNPMEIIALASTQIDAKVVNWRRKLHQNPELGNREFNTSEMVAQHLTSLGIKVQRNVAKTGVVGVLEGAVPGPVVALRADMDGLPVKERANLPYASKVEGEYNGQKVNVMHACGHDTHVAILMGVAEILSQNKNLLQGTVKFIFQPAEEGAPDGEEGGADLMVKEGVLENPKVDVIFGLHINAQTHVGQIKYKPLGTMAAADVFKIKVKGKQTHGAYPWLGADPVVAASQIVMGLQTIVSRNVNLSESGAVVSVGIFNGGVRSNIIPEEVNLTGTIRTLDTKVQDMIHAKIREVAINIAEAAGVKAEVEINKICPVTNNHALLTEKMLPTLNAIAGIQNVQLANPTFGAEDFSFFQEKVPGLFFFLGGAAPNADLTKTAPHHTPDFLIDDSGLGLGVKAMCMLTINYLKDRPSLK